jgi:hypothetical protein
MLHELQLRQKPRQLILRSLVFFHFVVYESTTLSWILLINRQINLEIERASNRLFGTNEPMAVPPKTTVIVVFNQQEDNRCMPFWGRRIVIGLSSKSIQPVIQ